MPGGAGASRSRQYKLERIQKLVLRDGPNCKMCQRPLQVDPVPWYESIVPDDYPTIDHIISRYNGGTWHLLNLQLLCWPCHKEKSKQERKEMMKHEKESKVRNLNSI